MFLAPVHAIVSESEEAPEIEDTWLYDIMIRPISQTQQVTSGRLLSDGRGKLRLVNLWKDDLRLGDELVEQLLKVVLKALWAKMDEVDGVRAELWSHDWSSEIYRTMKLDDAERVLAALSRDADPTEPFPISIVVSQ